MNEIMVNINNFENEITNTDKLVLVDFFAPWCGPCMMLSPIISELSVELKDSVKVCKINTDDNQELALKYQVYNIPTLMFFKNGKLLKTEVGYYSKDELKNIINNL